MLEVRPKPGRPAAITGSVRQQLVRELKEPDGFSSYERINGLAASCLWREGGLQDGA